MVAFFGGLRKAAGMAVAGLAALALVGCDVSTTSSSGPSIDPSAPVRVALLVPRGSTQGGDALLA